MKFKLLCLTTLLAFSLSACQQKTEEPVTTTSAISTLTDLSQDSVALIALGNDQVPVGRYGKEALESIGIWEDVENKISYGSNVKEVLSQVEYGAVDCGIVYATDANGIDGVAIVEHISGDLLASPIYYPAALMADSTQSDLAAAFLYELIEYPELFTSWGFTPFSPTVAEGSVSDEDATLTIFAAASLTEIFTEFGETFEEQYPQVELVFNFDSSGTLRTQIEYGAACDLFFSASTTEVEALIASDHIHEEDSVLLVENQLVLIVPN